jgi:predicted chitinase
MKITQMIRLLEEADETKIHVLGDSHAVAIAGSITDAVNSARNGAGIRAVASTAQAVPDNSRVVLSVGNNNVAQPAGVDRSLINILKSLTDRGCSVVYVGFPEIELASDKPSTTTNNGQKNENRIVVKISNEDDTREMTAAELAEFRAQQAAQTDPRLRLSVQVPARLPLKYVYRNAGYTEEYNKLRNQLMTVAAPMDGVQVVALTKDEVNPADPMGIHATANAYARVAGEAVSALETMSSGAENTTSDDDAVVTAADQLDPKEFEELDLNGDGQVTMGEYNQYMADNNIDPKGFDIPTTVASGLESIFGILIDYNKRITGQDITKDQLTAALYDSDGGTLSFGDTSNISGGAELSATSGNQAENALILAARRKWADVQDREVWIAALIAQCRVETANFTLSTEKWGPTSTQLSYDIEGTNPTKARQLGNDQPGDGFKYRGRGWIQLTGKANYQAAAPAAGADIVNNPDLAAGAAVANRTAIHYFETRVMNRTQANNIVQISRLVNGGNNGLAQRVAAFEQLLDNLRQQAPITQAGAAGENGRLDTNMLTSIGGNHKLIDPAAQAYLRMVRAAEADGIEWTITDSYRTYEAQVDVARRKGLYSQGGLAAEPGTSNHGWGKAVDLGGGANNNRTPENNWLRANAPRFGFTTIAREPWHWEWNSHNG